MKKSELKKELLNFKQDDTAVSWYGIRGIAKDLWKEIGEEEQIQCIVDGCPKSALGLIKYGRYFRTYLVLTDKRIIYAEHPTMILSILLFFLKKNITYRLEDINEIYKDDDVNTAMKIFFKTKLVIKTDTKDYVFFAVKKEAVEHLIEKFKSLKSGLCFPKSTNNLDLHQENVNDSEIGFCIHCGKKVQKEWKVCPYCENEL